MKRSLLLILALFAALGLYHWVHKPITPAQALAVGSAVLDALAALWLMALGGGVGRRLTGAWANAAPGERMAAQAALGLGALGLAMLGLGLVRGYYALEIIIALVVMTLVLWREMRAWLADAAHTSRALWQAGWLNRLAALFTIGVLLTALLRALAPPLMWDALVYHLTLPKLYAQTHHLRLDMDFMFSGMPQLTEMLYTAAYVLRGPMAAQTLGWLFGAVLAVGLAAHTQTIVSARYGALAPALLLASFTIALSLSWAYAETLFMLLGLALLIALRQWRLSGERKWFILSGALAGLALGCKYTAGILALGGAAVISLQPSAVRRQRARWVLEFGIWSLLFFAPWLLKNFLFTGNPIFPLAVSTPAFDSLRQAFYSRIGLAERNPLWAALIFARGIFMGVQGGNNYDATLTPLLLVLPLGLLFGWRRLDETLRAELRPILFFVGAAYAGWVAFTFVSPLALQARLFFGLFPALVILGVGGLAAIAALDAPALRPSVIVSAALALVIALSAFEYGADSVRVNPLSYLLGQRSAQKFREDNLGWYAVALDKINALPAGARVVFVWETRSLECAAPERCAPDTVIDRWWYLRRTVGYADSILAHWRGQGFTHVLIYNTGATFVREVQRDEWLTEADWSQLETLRVHLRLIENFGDAYSLYALP